MAMVSASAVVSVKAAKQHLQTELAQLESRSAELDARLRELLGAPSADSKAQGTVVAVLRERLAHVSRTASSSTLVRGCSTL